MNDNTAKLIEQLAAKMGTTSEYLWGVLMHQAPVNATITLLQFFLIGVAWYWLYRGHKYLLNEDNKFNYEDYNGMNIIMGIVAALLLIITIVAFFSIDLVINGYFNPEFWALDYVLRALK